MRNLFILTLIFLLTVQFLEAQKDKSNYALLWEITGNDLEQASYLFGTMHVRDKRAAEFPDSLFIALENVDAYAMEIHPDSVMQLTIDLFFPSENTTPLKDRLSSNAYERLNKVVLKKTGKPLDSLENQDPAFIEHLLIDFDEPEYTKKNDQMVDLYLYKQAWLMNKAIYGLEELKDYNNVTDKFFQMFEKDTYQEDSLEQEAIDQQFETMLDLYRSGDIYTLQQWIEDQSVDEDYDSAMLDTRNRKMVAQMKELMSRQRIFCAVGTAHLPGKFGMLALLESEGYRVRKVEATFDGYTIKNKTQDQYKRWTSTRNEKFGYTIKTPNQLYNFNQLIGDKSPLFDLKMGMDMLDMNAFFVSSIAIPNDKAKNWKLEDLQELINDSGEEEERILLEKKAIKHQGAKGGEFKFKESGANSIWRVFIKNGIAYLLGVYRETGNLDIPSVQYFFNSITFYQPSIDLSNFKRFESKDGAYFITMPAELQYKRTEQQQQLETGEIRDMVIHTYVSSNSATGNYYLMQHSLLGAGVASENEQLLLNNSLSKIATKWGQPSIPIKDIKYEGLNGKEAVYKLEKETIHLRVLLRGSRIYVLIAGLPKPNKADELVADFFNSFELKDNLFMALTPQKLATVGIQLNLPTPVSPIFVEDEDEEYPQLSEWEYVTIDTLNGNSYTITAYQYPPYYEVDDMNVFIDGYRNAFEDNEQTINLIDTTFQNKRAWYVELGYAEAPGVSHSLLLFNGPDLLEISLYSPEKATATKAWEFYNTLVFDKSYSDNYFVSDRSELLLQNIQSRDSTTRTEAKFGLDRYQMSAANLPTIYKILEKDFPFDTIENMSIHDLMFQELLYTNDESTLPFMEQLFHKKATDKDVQADLLITLSDRKNEAAYDLFFKLLKDYRKEQFDGYIYNNLFASMRDTAALTANYYEEILSLRNNEAFQYYAYNLIMNLLQGDALSKNVVAKNRSLFLNDAKLLTQEYNLFQAQDSLSKMEKYWHLDALHIILGELPSEKETDAYLTSLLKVSDAELVSNIIDALLMHQQSVPDYAFETVAEDSYYWRNLLTNLEYEKNLDKIPASLFTQEKTIKSYVYKYLEDEYDELTSFNILEKRTYNYDGEQLSLYLFTFTIEGYEDTYLGVCSQPQAVDDINITPNLFDYSSTAYTLEKKEAIYRDLLESWLTE